MTVDPVGESPLLWLDTYEQQCERQMRTRFGDSINLFERQIELISQYVGGVGETRRGTHLTIAELKRSQDSRLLSFLVPAFLMFQALDNLQSARLNMLRGYLSVTHACLRNVAEALRWANAAKCDAQVARRWLNNEDYRKPANLVPDPTVQELMRQFDRLSKRGAHPLALARDYAVLAKPHAQAFLDNETYVAGIQSVVDLANQVSANFLFFLLNQFPMVLQKGTSQFRGKVESLMNELKATFDIRVSGNRQH